MIPLEEVGVLDRNAQYLGVPTSQLMENAGKAVADAVMKRYNLNRKKVLVLCGTGNNGGDGFVAARYLRVHCEVTVALLGEESAIGSDLARLNFSKIRGKVKALVLPGNLGELIGSSDIIIDAMLGVGLSGKMREPFASIVRRLNSSHKQVVSVDVPTGMGTDLAVRPTVTVTFHDLKEGMENARCGKVVVADIGIPKEAQTYIGPGEFAYLPRPSVSSRKGDNGRLAVVGGGPYTGAPAFCALAAYRTGADLVRILAPSSAAGIISSYSPAFIVHPLAGQGLNASHVEDVMAALNDCDALAIGPGLGSAPDALGAVTDILSRCQKPVVIDADAIRAVGQNRKVLKGLRGVITPHAGEFTLLTGERLPDDVEGRSRAVKAWAKRLDTTILLKGQIDIVSDGNMLKLNRTGNPGMTVGGTGDVLTGIVGALLARRVSPFNAARIGAITNGYSGDLAFAESGYSIGPLDVACKITETMKKFVEWWTQRPEGQ
ncbi:MAG: NAD(P)H-hydrate dehydratase [Euryarchaeota archaeon]|nr:NAD(P)H-hydrate dehydratase [Euryarchaeota archaeon]